MDDGHGAGVGAELRANGERGGGGGELRKHLIWWSDRHFLYPACEDEEGRSTCRAGRRPHPRRAGPP